MLLSVHVASCRINTQYRPARARRNLLRLPRGSAQGMVGSGRLQASHGYDAVVTRGE